MVELRMGQSIRDNLLLLLIGDRIQLNPSRSIAFGGVFQRTKCLKADPPFPADRRLGPAIPPIALKHIQKVKLGLQTQMTVTL